LSSVIGRDPRLQIAIAVDSGEEALRVLRRVRPDVISMDVRLPGANGFEATRRIMSQRPTAIVVVAADDEGPGSRLSVDALNAGALTVLRKPSGGSAGEFNSLAYRLCTQLVIMSQVKVITQTRRDGPARGASGTTAPPVALPPVEAACEMIG